MLALWIILGIVGYALGCILFIIVDVIRMMTTDAGYDFTFKGNLLDILDDNMTIEHEVGFVIGIIFWPLGIVSCLALMLAYFIDRTLIQKLKEWCKS